jgi:hypothetical protein
VPAFAAAGPAQRRNPADKSFPENGRKLSEVNIMTTIFGSFSAIFQTKSLPENVRKLSLVSGVDIRTTIFGDF